MGAPWDMTIRSIIEAAREYPLRKITFRRKAARTSPFHPAEPDETPNVYLQSKWHFSQYQKAPPAIK
jgi:hypothetical protein